MKTFIKRYTIIPLAALVMLLMFLPVTIMAYKSNFGRSWRDFVEAISEEWEDA
jgi:hypothetical protein